MQGDKTGDTPLVESLRAYIKEKYAKPGNVFCGVVHRLDRPVGGLVIFAKTSKARARLNEMFRNGDVHKTYWAITASLPADLLRAQSLRSSSTSRCTARSPTRASTMPPPRPLRPRSPASARSWASDSCLSEANNLTLRCEMT